MDDADPFLRYQCELDLFRNRFSGFVIAKECFGTISLIFDLDNNFFSFFSIFGRFPVGIFKNGFQIRKVHQILHIPCAFYFYRAPNTRDILINPRGGGESTLALPLSTLSKRVFKGPVLSGDKRKFKFSTAIEN